MYSPRRVADKLDKLAHYAPYGFPDYSVDDARALTAQINAIRDSETGQMTRLLTEEEEIFAAAAKVRVAVDARFYLETFVWIDEEGHGLRPLFPLWESQRFLLNRLAVLEDRHHRDGHPDGLLINILKARQLGMCVDPSTRVLTADLRWVAIDSLDLGAEVVSVDEHHPGGKGAARKMRTAVVEAKRDVFAQAYEITLSDGRTLTATGEHRFLYRTETQDSTQWRTVSKMRVGGHIRYITRPWADISTPDAWFGGLVDGEGSLHSSGAGAEVNVSQVAGLVYSAAENYLKSSGYNFRVEVDKAERRSKFGSRPVNKLCVSRMEEIFRLIGQTRPVRFVGRRWWEGKELPGKRNGTGWAQIVSIKPVGQRRMVDIQTSTKTFIAEGFVSHNSTMAESLVSHRIFTQPYIRAIAGSDVEEQARYLFRMVERIYMNLPWFIKPSRIVPYQAGRELHLDNQSSLKAAWGKTTRGALQETGGKKGNIERGRSQPLNEPVLTPTGWVPMGDIRKGDMVVGRNGRPTAVIGVFPQGHEQVYRVTFNDGSWTRCSGDHIWEVTTAARRWSGQAPFVRTTLDLLSGGLFWDKPSGRMAKWFVPTVAPVAYAPVNLPIPAYTLGAYLGDGSTRAGGLQFSCRDAEIKERVASELPESHIIGSKEYNHSWYVRRANKKASSRSGHAYLDALKYLGLRGKGSYDKFIPTCYRMAPIADRIALLQGLMDTDGTASRSEGKINFSTVSPTLAVDFQELVESLGGIARYSIRPPQKPHTRRNGQRIVGKHSSFVFSICLPDGIVPFHLQRKIAQLVPGDHRKYFPSRAIASIEHDGIEETQCIRVSASDQLYVTRRFAVTHNTNSVVHISELATWDNPEQLDQALLPGVPVNPDSLLLYESTAELAGDWWHLHWQACEDGDTPRDWSNIFIPWCVEPTKYSLPAPTAWTPNDHTLSVARQIEREMPHYVGESVHLNRDQLYWYETTRAYYLKKNQLYAFLREFPSNPKECFQYAGRSVFTPEDMERIDQAARPMIDVWRVEPSREIAELRRMSDDPETEVALAVAMRKDARPPAPAVIRPISTAAKDFQVPPGYGFRRIGKDELEELPNLRQSVMAIWEYPRVRGRRRYVMSVDVGDGLGLDYSVVTIVREPTIDEEMEDVAQYVSNRIKPSQLAYVCDALGRFYHDEDGVEAMAAIELNNHGAVVQDLLQLHLGYTNFYVWEVVDAAQAEQRFTKRIGWTTTQRTRPILLERFHDSVTNMDAISDKPDFRVNSAVTRAEMRFFVTENTLGEAEHAKGQHDDAIFSAAIGGLVAHRMAGGETEPIAERRRRRDTLKAQRQHTSIGARDYRNSDITSDDVDQGVDDDGDDDSTGGGLFFDPRNSA